MRLPRITRVLALLAAVGTAAAVTVVGGGTAAAAPSLVVQTDKGAVQGAVAGGVEGFLGIPYAAAPVGTLRWKPPQPAAAWTGVRPATGYGSQCPQSPGLDSKFGSTDENCLFVNVQRPVGTRSDAKLPVYVYIHGGGFVTGSGENLDKVVADTDVVGVSLNYRLGALGFLALPALTAGQGQSGNYGLQDQQAALAWVQRNIGRFGGDPSRVTIGGESAGGFSVCYHLVAPGSRHTFAQAMIQSGGCPSRTQSEAEAAGTSVAASLGCADPATALACLRGKPVSALLAAPSVGPEAVRGTPFLPVDPAAAIRSGAFQRVPMVVGGQRDEARSFLQNAIGWTKEQYVGFLDATFGSTAAAVLAHYPYPASGDPVAVAYQASAVATDSGVFGSTQDSSGRIRYPGLGGCGTRELTREFAKYTLTYSYEFAHRSGPGWTDVPGFVWGAGHATELNYLFPQHGITTESEYHEFGPAEFGLANQLVRYWGAFTKRGVPVTPGQPLWGPYQAGHLTLSLRAGADGSTRLISDAQFSAEHQCGFWDSIAAR
jgi:carboxylesterase type B